MMNSNPKHYWRHFGLQTDPFDADAQTPAYISEQWQGYLDFLSEPSRYANALLMVVGAEGVGKTTLCQQVSDILATDVQVHTVNASAEFGAEHLSDTLSQGFNLSIDIADHDVYDAIDQQLASLQAMGGQHLLIIDDAETLPLDAKQLCLYIVKHQIVTRSCLNIVLVGKPELSETFNNLINEQDDAINNYVVNTLELAPFTEQQTDEFLQHCLQDAGDTGKPTLLGRADKLRIYQQSQGLPNAVKIVAQQSLMQLYQELQQAPVSATETVPVIEAKTPRRKLPVENWLAGKSLTPVYWWGGVLLTIFILLYWIYPAVQRSTQVDRKPLAIPQIQTTSTPLTTPTTPAATTPTTSAVKATSAKQSTMNAKPSTATDNKKMVRLVENGEVKWVPESQIEQELHPQHVDVKKATQPVPTQQATLQTHDALSEAEAIETNAIISNQQEARVIEKKAAAPTHNQHLTAVEQRLLNVNPAQYTLQLLVASSEARARDFVKRHNIANLTSIYRLPRATKNLYVVVLGHFANRKQALASIGQLDKAVAAVKPWPRSYASVQHDIKQLLQA